MSTSTHNSSHHHHKQTDPAQERKRFYSRLAAMIFFALAVVMLIPYIVTEFIPFIRAVTSQQHQKVNVSTICYIALRISMMLIPIAIAFPGMFYKEFVDKLSLVGKILGITSFLFFAGMVADVFAYNALGGYVDIGEDPIMLKMLWGETSLVSVAFCFVQGVLYLLLSKKLRDHKKNVVILFTLAFVLYIAMPIVRMLISGTEFFTPAWNVWFFKNIWFSLSNLFLLIGLIIASTSRWLWATVFWK